MSCLQLFLFHSFIHSFIHSIVFSPSVAKNVYKVTNKKQSNLNIYDKLSQYDWNNRNYYHKSYTWQDDIYMTEDDLP